MLTSRNNALNDEKRKEMWDGKWECEREAAREAIKIIGKEWKERKVGGR